MFTNIYEMLLKCVSETFLKHSCFQANQIYQNKILILGKNRVRWFDHVQLRQEDDATLVKNAKIVINGNAGGGKHLN